MSPSLPPTLEAVDPARPDAPGTKEIREPGNGAATRPWWLRALAWMIVGTMAAVLGTLGWAASLALLLVGLAVDAVLGLGLPAWSMALAFAVGMPLGAWLELTDVRWG